MGEIKFATKLCLTHKCNLNCIYCYQKHDNNNRCSLDTAKSVIDRIFDNVPKKTDRIDIGFIGGEPLLEFDLLKEIVAYTCSKERNHHFIFNVVTNGTMLTKEMKDWFIAHKNLIALGLSLDGSRETHNHNRSNSFDDIDIDFFITNWQDESIKMTLSEYSLPRLADNIKYLHSRGIKKIEGVNFAEATINWDSENLVKLLAPQLKELVEFYVDNETLYVNRMLYKRLFLCEAKREKRKPCGVGIGCPFFDVDGKAYHCSFITPMTFSEKELTEIGKIDFNDIDIFVDNDCFENCYIEPICPTCVGANYFVSKTFKKRDKRRCRVQKLISLFIADLQAKRIAKNPKIISNEEKLYHTIEAIKKIRSLYLPEFEEYLK